MPRDPHVPYLGSRRASLLGMMGPKRITRVIPKKSLGIPLRNPYRTPREIPRESESLGIPLRNPYRKSVGKPGIPHRDPYGIPMASPGNP